MDDGYIPIEGKDSLTDNLNTEIMYDPESLTDIVGPAESKYDSDYLSAAVLMSAMRSDKDYYFDWFSEDMCHFYMSIILLALVLVGANWYFGS